ncbi:MAG: cyclic nucleotide-binding domain-containing protein [Myxococcaceae bacterium]|nr:cyclic nucleotide-binding domain-containing protein [Myxococcaceae bacterium]
MADAVRELKDKGAQLFAKGKHDAALEAYQKAEALAPGDLAVRQKVAELLQRTGRTAAAVKAWSTLSRLLAQGGHLLRAIAACKVVLSLDPKHSSTQAMLAELYAQKQGLAQAPAAQPLTAAPAAPAPAAAAPEIELEIEVELPKPTAAGGLPSVPLFSSLKRDEFIAVLEGMEVRTFEPGEDIVREGEVGTSMYAIVEGVVDVLRHQEGGGRKAVAQMKEGDVFGEIALITDAPRLASVTAAAKCVVLEFTREKMQEIIARHPGVEEVMNAFYRERLLANVLRSNPLFAALPESAREELAKAFEMRTAEAGEMLLTHGAPGEALYVLLRGECTAFHPNEDGTEKPYPPMREGDVFGEISLLLRKDVSASVRAKTKCTLLRLSRADFDRLMAKHPAVKSELVKTGFERLQRTARLSRI